MQEIWGRFYFSKSCSAHPLQFDHEYVELEADHPKEAICQKLESMEDVDCVVMGSRGLGTLTRYKTEPI